MGWLPDRPDPRDRDAAPLLYSRSTGRPPEEWDNFELIPDILDQGPHGECVANACATAIRAAQIREGMSAPLISRKFGYWAARRTHNAETVDGGTYIRSFFYAAQKVGMPPERYWPHDSPVNDRPSLEAINIAHPARLEGKYARITSVDDMRVLDVQKALAMRYLVVFGTTLDERFPDVTTQVIGPMTGTPIGGHAMALAAYNRDYLIAVNSWGRGWGMGGMCKLSYDWLKWPATRDLWIVKCGPRFS